jgi:hypothetical protein
MSFIKTGHKLNFKEFNDYWAKKGNFTYLVCSKNIEKTLSLEEYLIGLGFIFKATPYGKTPFFSHHSRKNFNIRVAPFSKIFYRTKDTNNFAQKYYNVYDIDFFKNCCFKYVLIEKHIEK